MFYANSRRGSKIWRKQISAWSYSIHGWLVVDLMTPFWFIRPFLYLFYTWQWIWSGEYNMFNMREENYIKLTLRKWTIRIFNKIGYWCKGILWFMVAGGARFAITNEFCCDFFICESCHVHLCSLYAFDCNRIIFYMLTPEYTECIENISKVLIHQMNATTSKLKPYAKYEFSFRIFPFSN